MGTAPFRKNHLVPLLKIKGFWAENKSVKEMVFIQSTMWIFLHI
jgi:hypothetical protein